MSNLRLFRVKFVLINPVLGFILTVSCLLVGSVSATAQPTRRVIAQPTRRVIAQPTRRVITPGNQNLINQGRLAYQTGRYSEAKTAWQQAYQQSQAQEHTLAQAQTLNYLALANHKLGEWKAAKKYLTQSLELLQNQSDANSLEIKAQTYNTQGRLELGIGKAEAALESWQQAGVIYRQAGDEVGALGIQINQAQAWQSLGLYRRAQKSLEHIANKLEKQSDPTLKITGLRSLGIALQVTGDLQTAQEMLNQSLILSQELNLPEESSTTLFSLGNTALASTDKTQAINYYQQAAATTSQPLLKTEAQLNQLGLLISTEQWQQTKDLLPEIQIELANLADVPSRRMVYARVNLAKHLIELTNPSENKQYFVKTQDLLKTSIQQAKELEDTQAESYALGILGHLYEEHQQIALGRKYTQKAVQLAQVINNSDLTYQWQWQLGRLLKTEGNQQGAIAPYSEAVKALESLRGDLVVTNSDVQFSFRESIEPVYRELVSLLLTPANDQPVSQDNLLQARNTIESLQLAELNNFFREACLDATPKAIDEIDRQAAVIYPIILSDRLEVIVALPGQPLSNYSTEIPQAELEAEIEQLRQTVTIRSRRQFYKSAQNLYNWLIRPALTDLANSGIETLVFVPDGTLRNIPMAVLHDGEHYLLENYNVALTPGLQLLAPRPLEEVELKTLAAGLTEKRQGFAPLDYVKVELEDIQNQLNSTVLLNQQFTQKTLIAKMESAAYPIVHIATHGQFSSVLEDTFLLTWDSRIQIDQLDRILKTQSLNQEKTIELLVLSACETAVGDRKAALGLAGLAVRAGARSTLATLWSVNDRTTALAINSFYQQLGNSTVSTSKTKALRQAQLTLINSTQFNHPFYWAPFVLVGNWL